MSGPYDFHTLSPLDFEELVRDLLQAEWKVRFETFGPGADQGIDARFSNGPNSWIIQAKHMLGTGYRGLLRELRNEASKVAALSPQRYSIATSVSLTPARKDEITATMKNCPLIPADVFGQEDINNLLRRHPEVERQHYKLWLSSATVLERILRAGVYNRTAAEMDIIRAMVPRFVQNQSVAEAEAILAESGALIITGPPGVGKTTLARILLWKHAEQGWRVFAVDSLEDALSVADPTERRLILLDDFLGQVRLSADHVRGIDARLPPLIARVAAHKNLRFILTTRDYILAQARELSARLGKGRTGARDYVLDVGRYTRVVKARILYNHLFFSALTLAQRDEVLADEFFLKIIDHKNFNPRIIDELTNPEYVALTGASLRGTIQEALDAPGLLWERPYRQHISREGKALMLALFFNGRWTSVAALKSTYVKVTKALGVMLHQADVEASFRSTFRSLDGSVMALSDNLVAFTNPGVRDYLQSTVAADGLISVLLPELDAPDEIKEAWAVFAASRPTQAELKELKLAWIDALDRLEAGGDASRYDYLELALEMHSRLSGEELEERIGIGIEAFEAVPMDGDEVSNACRMLENAACRSLPNEIEMRLRTTLTTETSRLLVGFGETLSLEDIQSLDDALHRFGLGEDALDEAYQAAVPAIEKCVTEEVGAIETLDELDAYERDLIKYMKKRSFSTAHVEATIDRRRDRLLEADQLEREEGYRGSSSFIADASGTDAAIKSMFRGLIRK